MTTLTDTAPTMDDDGKIVRNTGAFTRAGCDFEAFATANMEIENTGTDLAGIFGSGSPEVQRYNKDPDSCKDQEVADYEGIAVHRPRHYLGGAPLERTGGAAFEAARELGEPGCADRLGDHDGPLNESA